MKLEEKCDDALIGMTIAANTDWAERLNLDANASHREAAAFIVNRHFGFSKAVDEKKLVDIVAMGMSVIKSNFGYFPTIAEMENHLSENGCFNSHEIAGELARNGKATVYQSDGKLIEMTRVLSPDYNRQEYSEKTKTAIKALMKCGEPFVDDLRDDIEIIKNGHISQDMKFQ